MLEEAIRENLRVVLVETHNPLNIGASARAMSNFGFLRLRLVNPYDVAFVGARSAVGAAELLQNAVVFSTLDEAVADSALVVGTTAFRSREAQHAMLPLAEAAQTIREQLASARVALLFGSETRGLSNDDLSRCHVLTHIPTREQHLSMNLGQAVALTLYEISRDPAPAPAPALQAPATVDDMERLTVILRECLHLSGYIQPELEYSSELKIRRALRRLPFSRDDAQLWLGMLRQILWKLRNSPAAGDTGAHPHV